MYRPWRFVIRGNGYNKVQAKRHEKASQAGKITTQYSKTREEALKWLEEFGI